MKTQKFIFFSAICTLCLLALPLQAQVQLKPNQLEITSDGSVDYPLLENSDRGFFRVNRFGQIHLQNNFEFPTELWHIGPRDNQRFDIAYGVAGASVVSSSNTRLTILPTGEVGIGDSDPAALLTVSGPSNGKEDPTAIFRQTNGNNNPIRIQFQNTSNENKYFSITATPDGTTPAFNLFYNDGTDLERILRFQPTSRSFEIDANTSRLNLSSSTGGFYIYEGDDPRAWFRMFNDNLYINANDDDGGAIIFLQNGTQTAQLDSEGDFGIGLVGTSTPSAKLDIVEGVLNAGEDVVELSMNTLSDATATYITGLRGTTTTDFRIYKNGSAAFGGKTIVGSATTTPANIESDFHIKQNSANNITTGLRLEDNDGTYWNIWTDNGDDLLFNNDGTSYSQIVGGTGAFDNFSDARLKENVEELGDILPKVLELRPTWYNYKSDAKKRKTLGFIAQEVQELLPAFVNDRKEYLALTYDYFGVASIKAIQEFYAEFSQEIERLDQLEAENRRLQNENRGLHNRLSELEELVQSLIDEKEETPSTLNATGLLQNQPNPFNQETRIEYYIPEGARDAELRIIDMQGRLIQTISLEGQGAGTTLLQAGTLASGTYSYSLFVDGKQIDSKKMVLTR